VTEILDAMTAPDANGRIHAKRVGPKGLMPNTWVNRTLRVEYVGAAGETRETSATLLDLYPAGPILNIGGGKTLLCWERLVLAELVEE
jgi:hypothetical protein